MSELAQTKNKNIKFAALSIVLGIIGWFASFELLTEFIKTLKTPEYKPNCNISVLITCQDNMYSWQGSLLGFSNTIIGVTCFVAPIAVGVALLAGARFKPWFWRLYQAGLFLAWIFISWLAYHSIFSLGVLCPWCMVVWSVTIPLWWTTFFRTPTKGDTPMSPTATNVFSKLYSWTWVFVVCNYLLIAGVAQWALDWFAEFQR